MFDEDLHIARIRRLTIEHIMTYGRAAQDFTDMAMLNQGEAHAAIFLRNLRQP